MTPARAPRTRRLVRRIAALVAAALTVMTIALTMAMFVDDADIDADRVSVVATVLAISPLRTGIEFVDGQGITIRPATGVLYPGDLRVGQQFMVEYSATDPSTVRVAGRTASNVLVSVVMTVVLTWLIAGPLIVWGGRPSVSLVRSGRRANRTVG